jgi:hypothetical protein
MTLILDLKEKALARDSRQKIAEEEYIVDPREKDYDRIIFFFMGLITLGVPVGISVFIYISLNS